MSFFDEPSRSPKKNRQSSNSSRGRGVLPLLVIAVFVAIIGVFFVVARLGESSPNPSSAPMQGITSQEQNATQLARQTSAAGLSSPLPLPTPDSFVTQPAPANPVVNATPLPLPSIPYIPQGNISDADRALFDQANNNTTAARSYRLDANISLGLGAGDESGSINFDGVAIFDKLTAGDLSLFDFSLDAQPSLVVNATVQPGPATKLLITNGIMYSQAQDQNGNTQWIGINFDEAFGMALDSMTDPQAANIVSDNLPLNLECVPKVQEVTQLLGFASRYIITNVIERTSTQLHVQSVVDLNKFIQSSDFDALIISLMTFSSGDCNIDRASIEQSINDFRTHPPITPQRLFIDHYINLADGRVEQVTVDFAATLDSALSVPGTIQLPTGMLIKLTINIHLSGYNQDFGIAPPPGAIVMEGEVLEAMTTLMSQQMALTLTP